MSHTPQARVAYPASKFVISMTQLVFVIVMVAHWMCSLWFFVGYTPNGWVVSTGLAEVLDEGDPSTGKGVCVCVCMFVCVCV